LPLDTKMPHLKRGKHQEWEKKLEKTTWLFEFSKMYRITQVRVLETQLWVIMRWGRGFG
jgi:hypothetical protein